MGISWPTDQNVPEYRARIHELVTDHIYRGYYLDYFANVVEALCIIQFRDGLLSTFVQEKSNPIKFINWWNANADTLAELDPESKAKLLTLVAGAALTLGDTTMALDLAESSIKYADDGEFVIPNLAKLIKVAVEGSTIMNESHKAVELWNASLKAVTLEEIFSR